MVKKYMDETKKGFMQNIGDLSFKKIDETNYEFSIKVEEKFLNTGKIAHGGFIATIADTGMGNAAHIVAGNKRSVTVNLDIKYICTSPENFRSEKKFDVILNMEIVEHVEDVDFFLKSCASFLKKDGTLQLVLTILV